MKTPYSVDTIDQYSTWVVVGILIVALILTSCQVACAAEASSPTSSEAMWLIGRGIAHLPKDLTEDEQRMLYERRPAPTVNYQGYLVNWSLDTVYKLPLNDDVTIYSAKYFPKEDVDIDSASTFVVLAGQQVIHSETSDKVSPTLVDKPLPALALVRSDGSVHILFTAYSNILRNQTLSSLSKEGVSLSTLITPGNGEYTVHDLDEDGTLEFSGYGLMLDNEADAEALEANSRATLLEIERFTGVSAYPALSTTTLGPYEVYLLTGDGRFMRARGNRWKRYYEYEAATILPEIQKLGEQDDWPRTVDATLFYFGILEGIQDKASTQKLYLQLPKKIRDRMSPKLIAKYWASRGYPNLLEVFSD